MEQNWLIHDGTGSVGDGYWLVLGGTWSVWDGTGWYLVLLGQCNLVLLGIKCYWVNIGPLGLYILKKWRFGRVLP